MRNSVLRLMKSGFGSTGTQTHGFNVSRTTNLKIWFNSIYMVLRCSFSRNPHCSWVGRSFVFMRPLWTNQDTANLIIPLRVCVSFDESLEKSWGNTSLCARNHLCFSCTRSDLNLTTNWELNFRYTEEHIGS